MNYNWQRLWAAEDIASKWRRSGFTHNPFYTEDDVVGLDSLKEKPCLILLGEPGIGKSTVCGELETSDDEAAYLKLDLKSYGDEARLVKNLFEAPTFLDWLQSEQTLYLVLDSLDECLLRLDYVADLLSDEFRRVFTSYPTAIERIRLRIFCRTAVWSRLFETQLREIFRESKKNNEEPHSKRVLVYELLPLRRQDIVTAAQIHEVDAEKFLAEVSRKQVEPLAAKPVTLEFLLSEFAANNSLPATEAEIYAKGCLLLCEKLDNSTQQRAGKRRELEPEQRLALASRLAALTIFCNADSFLRESDSIFKSGDGVLPLAQAQGGKESILSITGEIVEFEITRRALLETLETGLFSSRGSGKMGWSHRSYAEFLAAYYLGQKQLSLRQLSSLFFHNGDDQKRLVPQLHETAARFIGTHAPTSREFFELLLEREPEVLLRSDAARLTDADKLQLTQALLERVEAQSLPELPTQRLHVLQCSGLEDLLRKWIEDNGKSDYAREEAISIADECQLSGLSSCCLQIALDPHRVSRTRQAALRFLIECGSDVALQGLRPLLVPKSDDVSGQLRGLAFQAMWPQVLSAQELFAVLDAPTESGLGNYGYFLTSLLIPHLKVEDLPLGLEWLQIQHQNRQAVFCFGIEQFQNALVKQVWQHLNFEPIFAALASLIGECIQHHKPLFGYSDALFQREESDFAHIFDQDVERRRALFETVLPRPLTRESPQWFHSLSVPLLNSQDLVWLLDKAKQETDSVKRDEWIRFVPCAVYQENISEVLAAGSVFPQLADFYLNYQTIVLNSSRANELKKLHKEAEDQLKDQSPPLQTGPTPQERILRLLDEFETGDTSAWWKISCHYIALEDQDRRFNFSRGQQMDIRRLPGWQKATRETQDRLLNAALCYVQTEEPTVEKWRYDSPLNWRPDSAGYKAFRLIGHLQPEILKQLPQSFWAKWTPVIFHLAGFHLGGAVEEDDLLRMAYQIAPQALLEWLPRAIEVENKKQHDSYHFPLKVVALWDEPISHVVFKVASQKGLRSDVAAGLIEILLKQKTAGAEELAFSRVLAKARKKHRRKRKISTAIACHLVTHAADWTWEKLWPLLQGHRQWGREFTEYLRWVEKMDHDWMRHLKPQQLANYYRWLAQQYPAAPSSPVGQSRDIPNEESLLSDIQSMRANLAHTLAAMGSFQACEQLNLLRQQHPDHQRLVHLLYQALEQARRRTWVPPTVTEVMQLCSNPKARLIASEADLMDVVVDSLEEIGRELQGGLMQAHPLWSEWPDPKKDTGKRGPKIKHYQPKDEENFSRYVADQLGHKLKIKGVIIDREVEIRKGQYTDILVHAAPKSRSRGTFEQVTVVIEAKGSWHADIKTAMKDQLVDTYLRDNHCRHGIYLVGWFQCDLWDTSDSRNKPQMFAKSIEEAHDTLDQQAASLSQSDFDIRAVVLDARIKI